MTRTLSGDMSKAIGSVLLGFALPWIILGAVLLGVFSLGRCSKPDGKVEALRDTLRITDSVIQVKWDTVKVYLPRAATVKAQSDSLDALVKVRDDSTLLITDRPDSLISVPPIVVEDIKALRLTVATQDTTIRHLVGLNETQEWRYATARKLYQADLAKANAPRWGVGATIGYGCVIPHGCGPTLNVGITWQAKVPSPKQLLHALVK